MNHCDLSQAEQKKRKEIAEHTRSGYGNACGRKRGRPA